MKACFWTVRQAAIELGLSNPTVRRRAEALGLGWRTPGGQVVLEDDDLPVIAALGKRMNRDELPEPAPVRGILYRQVDVARMLGVTPQAVQWRVEGLGIGVKASHGHATWLTEEEVEWLKRIMANRRKR